MSPRDIFDVSEADLLACPRWLFFAGQSGEFDPFVTVVPAGFPGSDPESVGITLASYRFANGSSHAGYVQDANHPFHHSIFIGSSCVPIWSGNREPGGHEIAEVYRRFGGEASQMFPIEWETHDRTQRGKLEGFYFIDERNQIQKKK